MTQNVDGELLSNNSNGRSHSRIPHSKERLLFRCHGQKPMKVELFYREGPGTEYTKVTSKPLLCPIRLIGNTVDHVSLIRRLTANET